MADLISATDLPSAVAADPAIQMMLDGANATAFRVAPVLAGTPTDEQRAEAKLVLLGAVIRWVQNGAGAVQVQTAGPFGMTVDNRQPTSGYKLWPSEVQQLIDICSDAPEGRRAWSIDRVPVPPAVDHHPSCNFFFGGYGCSCGVA